MHAGQEELLPLRERAVRALPHAMARTVESAVIRVRACLAVYPTSSAA